MILRINAIFNKPKKAPASLFKNPSANKFIDFSSILARINMIMIMSKNVIAKDIIGA